MDSRRIRAALSISFVLMGCSACTTVLDGSATASPVSTTSAPTSTSPTPTEDDRPADGLCERIDADAITDVLQPENLDIDGGDDPAPVCVFNDIGGPGALLFVYDLSDEDGFGDLANQRQEILNSLDQVGVDITPDLGDQAYLVTGLNAQPNGDVLGQGSAGVIDGDTRWYLNLTASSFGRQTPEQLADIAERTFEILLEG